MKKLFVLLIVLLLALPLSLQLTAQDEEEEVVESIWSTLNTINTRIFDLALHPDESTIAALSVETFRQNQELQFESPVIEIFDIESGDTITEIRPADNSLMHDLAFAPDGMVLAVGYNNGDVEVYDMETYELITTIVDGYGGEGNDLLFSLDGQYLIGGGSTVNVMSTEDWSIVATTRGVEDEAVTHVAVSPDSTQLVTTDFGAMLNLHDIETGAIQTSLPDVQEFAGYVFWYADDRIMVETYDELRIVDVPSGEIVSSTMFDSVIQTIVVNPTGTQFLMSTFDNTLTQWDIESGEMLADLPLDTYQGPRFVQFGETVITVAEDGVVYYVYLDDIAEMDAMETDE